MCFGQQVQDAGGAGRAGEAGAVYGLFKGHAYSVLKFQVTKDGNAFVRIRNPWGNEAEWKGAYSDGSKEWKENPNHMRELQPEFKDDGAFWMKWEDFKKYFTDIDVCKFFPNDWEVCTIYGDSVGANYLTAENTILMEVKSHYTTPSCYITLGQDDPKCSTTHRERKAGNYGVLRLSIFKLRSLPSEYNQIKSLIDTKVETKKQTNRQVDTSLDLSPGFYCLIPQVLECAVGSPFFVRVFTPAEVEISLWKMTKKSESLVTSGAMPATPPPAPALPVMPMAACGVVGTTGTSESGGLFDFNPMYGKDGMESACQRVFKVLDGSHTGKITKSQAETAFKELLLSTDIFTNFCAQLGGHDTLSLEDFVAMASKAHKEGFTGKGSEAILPSKAGKGNASQPQRSESPAKASRPDSAHKRGIVNTVGADSSVDDTALRELFDSFDRDSNGRISMEEFKKVYRTFENFGAPLTEKDVDRVFSGFKHFDKDNDGSLSFEEFCVLMLQRMRM